MKLFATIIAAMGAMEVIGIIFVILLLLLMLAYPTLANRKREKEVNRQLNELYSSIEIGDRIKTVGGIIGNVVQISENSALECEIVLETGIGDNKTTIIVDKQSIFQNLTKLAIPATSQEDDNQEKQEEPTAEQEVS